MADDRWDSRASEFERRPWRTSFKWGAAFLALVFCLGIVWGVLSWASSWGGEAKRITGPDNSREQTTAVLADWRGLQAAAGNACDAKTNAGTDSPTLVEDPTLAYRATYRRIKADYDRRMGNLFEAAATRKLPLPDALGGMPREAPNLTAMQREVC